MGFYDEMEQSLVNGELPKKHRLQARVDSDFEDKRYKADYLRLQIQFFDQLKYLSIKLKSIAIPERLGHLRRKLEEINQWIEGEVRKQVDLIPTQSRYSFNGVVLPFDLGDDEDPSIILNIVPELALAFDTKKRAPFRVVFETVRLSELKAGLFQQSEVAEPEPEAEERLEQVIEMTVGEEEEEAENPFAQTTFRNHEGNEETTDVTKDDVLEALGFESNMFESLPMHILRSSQSMHVQSTQGSLSEEKPALEKARSENEEQLNIAQANLIIEKMNRRSSNLTPTHAEESKAEELALRLEGMEDPFKEQWNATAAKVKSKSKFAAYQSYSLKTMIVKANDDLRQENLAMQLMKRL
jgi:hypothetical protein